MLTKRPIEALTTFFLLAVAAPAHAVSLVNVDFNQTTFSSSPTYSGAAVLGASGDIWNGIGGPFFSPSPVSATGVPLVDAANAATGVTLDYSVTGFFDAGSSTSPPFFTGVAYDLLRDYAFSSGDVTLSGLTAGTDYRVILYSSTNAAGRITEFTLSGVTQTVAPISTSNLAEGINYANFTTTADASGQIFISFKGIGTSDSEGSLNGLQIKAVPEPSSLLSTLVAVAGFLGLASARRFRRSVSKGMGRH